jgi:hypothetical protein
VAVEYWDILLALLSSNFIEVIAAELAHKPAFKANICSVALLFSVTESNETDLLFALAKFGM